MHSLLKRQIRKYLKDFDNIKSLKDFLYAVNRSYVTYEDQIDMIQHTTDISSNELFIANKKLKLQAEKQTKTINSLKKLVDNLKLHTKIDSDFNAGDVQKLTKLIDDQTNKIIEISKQRKELLKKLEITNQDLSDYAHIVSHDLKSPLRNINALTNWIKTDYSECLDSNGIETLDLILQNTEKMEMLIKGILDYSSIDNSETKSYDVDIDDLVKQIINTTVKPNNIKITVLNKFPIVKGDKFRFLQLFQNLIQNAVKYSKPSGGEIHLGVKDIGDCWQFYIKDQGIGIDKAYHTKIFEVFKRLTDKADSTGIGLSIVKKIITYYNCKIWVESEIDVGTTFYFTLPKQ